MRFSNVPGRSGMQSENIVTPAHVYDRCWHYIGITGVVLMLLGVGSSKGLQSLGMVLAVLALLATAWRPDTRAFWRDPLVRLGGVWVALLLLLASLAAWRFPDTAALQFDYVWKLSRFLLVVVVAWWVARALRSPVTAAWWLVAGYALGALYFLHQAGWPWYQPGVNFVDIWEGRQFYALLSASIIMLLVLLARDLLQPGRGGAGFWLRLVPWLLTLLIAINGFLLSQSRGAVLALAVGTLLAVILAWRAVPEARRRGIWSYALAVLCLVGLVWLGTGETADRFARDYQALSVALEDPDAVPETDMGIRWYQWREGWRLWLERPVLGWGPGSGRMLHEMADLPPVSSERALHHFHSVPLDLLMWTGLIGLALFGWLAWRWSVALGSLARRSDEAGRSARLALVVGLMFVVASLTQTYITSQVTWFYLAGFLGPAYGLVMRAREHQARHMLVSDSCSQT